MKNFANEKMNVFYNVKLSIKAKMLVGIIIALLISPTIAVFINGWVQKIMSITGNFSIFISTGINILVVSVMIMVQLNLFVLKPLGKVILSAEKLAAGDVDIDIIPNPVMIINKDLNIKYINEAGASFVQREQQEIIGNTCSNLFKTSLCNTQNCTCMEAMKQNRSIKNEATACPN